MPPSDGTQPPAKAVAKEAELEYMELLAKSQPPASVQWLQAGNRRFLALYEPAITPSPKGTVVMLHGAGEHADWPGTLSTLRHYLPQIGWSTLAIALPPPDLPKLPPAKPSPAVEPANAPTPADDENQNHDESQDIFDSEGKSLSDGTIDPEAQKPKVAEVPGAAEEITVDRIIAALAFLQEAGNTSVILYGQGLGATRAAEYLFDHGDPEHQINGLLLVAADNRLPGKDFVLTQGLNNPALPILDIYASTSKADADLRSAYVRMREFDSYRQLEVPLIANNEAVITRHIHGFLHSRFDAAH